MVLRIFTVRAVRCARRSCVVVAEVGAIGRHVDVALRPACVGHARLIALSRQVGNASMRRGHRAPLVVGVLITTRRATALSVPGIFARGDVLFGQGSVLPPRSSEIVERVCRRAVSGHLNSRERTNQISACRRNSRDPVGAPGAAGQATLSLRLLGHRFARKGGHTRPHLAHRRLRNPRGERCNLRSGVRGDEKADLDRLPSARDRDGTCRARRPLSAHILRRSLPPRTRRVRGTAIAHRPACVRTSHLAPRALRRGARPTT